MLYDGLKISFDTNWGNSYKVCGACFFTPEDGVAVRVNPSGSTFDWSPNVYNTSNDFQDGYIGTGQWHGNSISGANPFWGLIEFPSPRKLARYTSRRLVL